MTVILTSSFERDVLIQAINLLKTGWCQDCMAMDSRGEPVSPNSSHACRWCATGALNRAAQDLRSGAILPMTALELLPLVNKLSALLGEGMSVVRWQDSFKRTADEVIALFQRMIAVLDKEVDEDDRA